MFLFVTKAYLVYGSEGWTDSTRAMMIIRASYCIIPWRRTKGREMGGREKEVKTVRLTSTTNPMSESIVHSCTNDINPSMQAKLL